MNMKPIYRLFPAIVAIFGMLLVSNAAFAARKAEHHDAKKLLGDNLKHDGHHDFDHHGKFTTSVEVSHGKIAAFHVKHSERGDIPVKNYKTHKKMVEAAHAHLVYASLVLTQDMDMGTVYIGYSYIDDDGNEEIYWVPEEMVIDGDTGAVEYVPTS
jgi:hypothetical protein